MPTTTTKKRATTKGAKNSKRAKNRTPDFRIRIVGFKKKKAGAFTFNPLNYRRHGEAQRQALRTMLGDVGWVQGVIENKRTGNLIDGHARIEEALRDDADQLVPYLVVDLSPAEEKAVLATLDPIGAMAEIDPATLDQLYKETIVDMPGLEQLLASLHHQENGEASGTPATEPPDTVVPIEMAAKLNKKWKVKKGDVWAIGPHRLMCGDCREVDQVKRLIGKVKINVAVTSPPYAERRKYDEETEFQPIAPDKYVAWFQPVAENVATHLAPDGSWFLNIKASAEGLDTDLYVLDLVLAHVRQWGWHFATEFCWERNGVPKRVDQRFKNQFEPVYQFARARWKCRPTNVQHPTDSLLVPIGPGAGATNWDRNHGSGGNFFARNEAAAKKKSNILRGQSISETQGSHETNERTIVAGLAYPGNRLPPMAETHEATGHSAAFPVGLPAFFIKAFSDERDRIYDPFMGSGSTMVAAQQNKRRAFGMELSPKYCAIVLERMATNFGLTIKRE